ELALVEHQDIARDGQSRDLENVAENDEAERDATQPVEAHEAATTADVGAHRTGTSTAVGSAAGAAAAISWRRTRRPITIETNTTSQKYFSYSALMKVPDTRNPTKPARSPSPQPASSSASGEPESLEARLNVLKVTTSSVKKTTKTGRPSSAAISR